MKNRAVLWVLLVVMLAAFAAIVSQKAIADGDHHGMPSGAGQFSTTAQGSIAICLDPQTFAEESCSTKGVLVAPLSLLDNGVLTADTQGNSCSTFTEVDSDLPVDATPPFVTPNEHSVGTVFNFDSTTGTGDVSFIGYVGGTCNGATFDSTGAKQVSTGTAHFVLTDNGKRVDFLITKLTNSANSIGDFSISGRNIRQTRQSD